MSQQDDSSFFRTFMLVLGALVVFTVFIAIIANMFSPATDRSRDPLVQRELARQIAPVGQSRVEQSTAVIEPVATASDEASATGDTADGDESDASVESVEAGEGDQESTPEAEAEDSAADGADAQEATTEAADSSDALTAEIPVRVKAVVATNCAGCHRDGLLGAQRSDDAEAWKALEARGLDTLTASVINGKGAMLPRAETTLSDEEITLAIRHMIAQATASDSAEQVAEGEEQEGDTVAVEEAPADESGDKEADEQSAGVEETSDEVKADDAATEESTSDSGDGESASDNTDAADTDAVATDSGEASGDTVAVAAAEIPDNVKTVVDSLCAGCHISGVANAPKYGDKAAWDERMAKGMDKVLAAAIAGKNAMPARGGSTLSDAELRLAIEYMLTK